MPNRSMSNVAQRLLARVAEARTDPNTFAELVFGITQADIHRRMQAHFTAHPRALCKIPRDHGKTTQTVARTIWEIGRNPRIRIKYLCAADDIAIQRVRFIREAIQNNPAVRLVFPHLEPANPWGDMQFTVKRPGARIIDPTIAALGIGSAATGGRADMIVSDDSVDVKAIRSEPDRERAKSYWTENLINLLEPDGLVRVIYTPWHRSDLNAELEASGNYALMAEPIGPDYEPVWPAKWPAEALRKRHKEIGTLAYTRGFRLECLSENDVIVRPEWIQFHYDDHEGFAHHYLVLDPANTKDQTNDPTGIVVLSQHPSTKRIRVTLATSRRIASPELPPIWKALDDIYQFKKILYESNAAQESVLNLILAMDDMKRYRPRVESIKQTRDKTARIAAAAISLEAGVVTMKGKPGTNHPDSSQQPLFDELTCYPQSDHDDQADAFSTGVLYLTSKHHPRIW